jgi:hypothetical protein
MAGGSALFLLFCFGLSAGFIGKIKGSSFFIWFAVGFVLPGFGTLAALLWRNERAEPRRRCPECNNVVALHDQVCMRCGRDLDWPLDEPAQPSGPALTGR